MNFSSGRPYQIAVFASDLWQHVCPTIRLVEPILTAGMQLIRGNEFENGAIQVHPTVIPDADFIVITRDFPRYIDEYETVVDYARKCGKPIIYELDDLLFELASVHPDVETYLETRPSILRAVMEADAVTVSTASLCDAVKPFNPNTWILPNYLVDKFWKIKPPKPVLPSNAALTIGYMGGHGHLPDMEMLYPSLHHILDKYPQKVLLKFWGLRPAENLLNRPNVSWTHPYLVDYAAFADYFLQQECDIFLAPLQDNIFNRCKSGLKFLEYSALGVAGVYSDLPPYNEIISNGKNGFLATASRDWEEQLERLIEDDDFRARMAGNAQDLVKQKWMLSQNSFRWQETYQQVQESYGTNKNGSLERANRVIRKTQKWYIDLTKKSITNRQRADEFQAQSIRLDETVSKLRSEIESLESKQTGFLNIQDKNAHKMTRLEEENAGLQTDLLKKEREFLAASARLVEFENNPTWKLFLRTRLAVAPVNSRRGKLLYKSVAALRLLRSKGFRAVISAVAHRLKNPPPSISFPSSATPESSEVALFAVDGNLCSLPALSLVYIMTEDQSKLDTTMVTTWTQNQTWKSWELIIWDKRSAQAWNYSNPSQKWPGENVADLIEFILGKYVCMVSPDLLQQNETYLEENLIALESENLAFTVNLNAKSEWTKGHLERGNCPGTPENPYQRMIVHKKCIKENFSIDLSLWLARQGGKPAVVGKVITHTTPEMELEGDLDFNISLANVSIKLINDLVIAQVQGQIFKDQVFHPIHPVDSVLPVIEMTSEKPTVLIFMPFLAVGGAERVALDMIRCLQDEIRFVVLTLDEHDPAIGTTVDQFRELTPYVYSGHDFLNRNLNFSLVNYLIKRFQPVTFYIANGSPWIYDALFTIKSFHPDMRLANQVYDHLAGWINRYDPVLTKILDANIGVNKKICDAFLEKGSTQPTIYQIENGVNTFEYDPGLYTADRLNSLKQKFNIQPDAKVVVFMARLHPQKRPMDFVEVARRCKDVPNLHFLMVGDGPLGKTIENEIATIGLHNFTHTPFYRPSSDIYALCDVFVLPSEYEGMPMVILEAQSMGKPVVITDVGNNREVLDITHGGVLLEKIGDIQGLKMAIIKSLAEPPDPLTVRQAIIDNFSLEIMGRKYHSALLGQ
jgi:glycosyltransferase involved in cell wall biosynthesis